MVNFLNFDDVKKSPNLEDIPKRTGDIRRIFITEKLKQIGVELSDLKLGDFDQIGELTAKKQRSPGSDLYNKVGAFFRPNYERGILIYSLIKKYKIKSYLEIGFGRGYSCMCAALAMSELGEGKITTIDPNLDNDFLQGLSQSFPEDWFSMIHFIKGTSQEFLRGTDEKYDFIYVDASHRADDTFVDAYYAHKMLNPKGLLIFDDYGWKKTKHDYERPKLAIDSFIRLFRDNIKIISKGYKMYIQKVKEYEF